jgi:DNA-nicking Smr family endonuclease
VRQKWTDQAGQAEPSAKKPPPPPVPPPAAPASQAGAALGEDEASALSLAMQGVTPLAGSKPGRVTLSAMAVTSRTARVAPFGRDAEEEARARLDALVSQDVAFTIAWEGDYVRGQRSDAPPRVLRELARRTRASETLDLHGFAQREARQAATAFVRRSQRLGLDVLCIVHGKGNHSEGGMGVLQEVVVRALTETAAARGVLAFVTAPPALGGRGALLVQLK